MQGFNMGRYVPPDLEGTISHNAASGKGHALGARARKLKSEGILVVRFECPFAIWCTNCQPEQIIGQGVRFNAEKKKVGNYYSTPIWAFRFKHTICGKQIEVRTDPKTAEYLVVEGGRRRDTGVDKLLDGEIRLGVSEEDKERLEKDGGFGVLEKNLEDKREADTQKRRINELADRSERDWADPYEMSRKLRKDFRVGRRQRQADEKSGEALQEKFGLEMDLLRPQEEDANRAALVEFGEEKIVATSVKPMFATGAAISASTVKKEYGERGKKGTVDVAVHKDALRNTLTGNTKSLLDPFLSGHQSVEEQRLWRPRLKRQKVEADASEAQVVGNGDSYNVTEALQGTGLVGYESDSL